MCELNSDFYDCDVTDGQITSCVPTCGDGYIIGNKECEDFDLLDGQGCLPDCSGAYPGWACK